MSIEEIIESLPKNAMIKIGDRELIPEYYLEKMNSYGVNTIGDWQEDFELKIVYKGSKK